MPRPVFGVDRDPQVIRDLNRPCGNAACRHVREAHRELGCVGTTPAAYHDARYSGCRCMKYEEDK